MQGGQAGRCLRQGGVHVTFQAGPSGGHFEPGAAKTIRWSRAGRGGRVGVVGVAAITICDCGTRANAGAA